MVSFPIWNFGIPAILKAYIDQIVVSGRTFRYGKNGPEGLLTGKKICFIFASGGDYSSSGNDMAYSYLKVVFNFIGITEQYVLSISGTSFKDGFESRWNSSLESAKSLAKVF